MDALGTEGGIIVGSVVQALLKGDVGRAWQPRDVNVIVPKGRGGVLKSCLEANGYTWSEGKVMSHMVDCCSKQYEYTHKDESAVITVTEASTLNVLATLFGCGNTATMNALTPRRLYSFYPKLTLTGRALTGYRWVDTYKERYERYFAQGIAATACTQDWPMACGYEACPAVARRVQGLRAIGVMIWNPEGREEMDLTELSIAWALNKRCWNVNCDNMGMRAGAALYFH